MDIKPYTKAQLAEAYAPNLTPVAALNRLAYWIRYSPGLTANLQATGYRPRQHHFTARQVSLIFQYLGEP